MTQQYLSKIATNWKSQVKKADFSIENYNKSMSKRVNLYLYW
jgi:hypothetical protein